MYASASPLLLWLYDDDIPCSMFSFWHNVLNLYEIRLVHALSFCGSHIQQGQSCMVL